MNLTKYVSAQIYIPNDLDINPSIKLKYFQNIIGYRERGLERKLSLEGNSRNYNSGPSGEGTGWRGSPEPR